MTSATSQASTAAVEEVRRELFRELISAIVKDNNGVARAKETVKHTHCGSMTAEDMTIGDKSPTQRNWRR